MQALRDLEHEELWECIKGNEDRDKSEIQNNSICRSYELFSYLERVNCQGTSTEQIENSVQEFGTRKILPLPYSVP